MRRVDILSSQVDRWPHRTPSRRIRTTESVPIRCRIFNLKCRIREYLPIVRLPCGPTLFPQPIVHDSISSQIIIDPWEPRVIIISIQSKSHMNLSSHRFVKLARILLSGWIVASTTGFSSARETPGTLETDITYAEVAGEKLLLDAHIPDGAGPFPVAILIHGGGWGSGSKEGDIAPLFKPLSVAKFTWFSINYRLAPKHRWPACSDDVKSAIRWVKSHAADYKGDPRRIALIGYSAGGHLACFAAVTSDDTTRVNAVVALAAPTDHPADTARRGELSPSLQALLDRPPTVDAVTTKLLEEISPIHYLKRDLPPFLLIHGTEDKSVFATQSGDFQTKLQDLNIPCTRIPIQGAPHRISEWETFDPGYQASLIAWLGTTLGQGK